MKTYLTFGFLLALAGFIVSLALFLAGLQSDADKLHLGEQIGKTAILVIDIVIFALGIRARRAERPPGQAFTYGQAALAGSAIAWWGAAFGMIGTYLYLGVINPHFSELIIQAKLDEAAAHGLSGDQLDRVERIARAIAQPGIEAVAGFFVAGVVGNFIALVTAAFFRRPAAEPAQPS